MIETIIAYLPDIARTAVDLGAYSWIGYLAYKHRKLRLLLKALTALGKTLPDEATIREWKKKLEENPVGSPKWRAYRNRLLEVGAMKPGDAPE